MDSSRDFLLCLVLRESSKSEHGLKELSQKLIIRVIDAIIAIIFFVDGFIRRFKYGESYH